jgi:hypothetical protein
MMGIEEYVYNSQDVFGLVLWLPFKHAGIYLFDSKVPADETDQIHAENHVKKLFQLAFRNCAPNECGLNHEMRWQWSPRLTTQMTGGFNLLPFNLG